MTRLVGPVVRSSAEMGRIPVSLLDHTSPSISGFFGTSDHKKKNELDFKLTIAKKSKALAS
jgi:hypothetical protein